MDVPFATTAGTVLGRKNEQKYSTRRDQKVLFHTCSLFPTMKPRNVMVCDVAHGQGDMVTSGDLYHHVLVGVVVASATGSAWGNWGPLTSTRFTQTCCRWHCQGDPAQIGAAMTNADGSGDTSQDGKVFVRLAEPVPTWADKGERRQCRMDRAFSA